MKRLFIGFALMSFLSLGTASLTMAQENSANDTTQTKVEAVTDSTSKEGENSSLSMENKGDSPVGIHKELKTKFIEGSAFFMSFVAIALVLGMAFCVERIIYLNLSEVDVDKLLEKIEKSLKEGNVEEAKEICRNTRGPVASIFYQGLMRLDQGVDVVEKSIISYGSVQGGLLERNLSWITLFIAMSPSLGFLGTVIGMVQAFDKIQQVGDISPTVVAGGMKVALITTIFGLIVALILQLFYNYLLSKVESIMNKMENSSISFLDLVIEYNLKHKK